ncbi:MAG: flavodoxin-dependent (E)-4-hydroxy-3-methylbut-2-enyl-diphosphate synthase, partial [Chloroflexota bacterium]|nr:flavodoxin-dependent (E)-4-hydroxy-3-methylbut-2-enyl-diphosphate synthase [Chloroflexota bacterium]
IVRGAIGIGLLLYQGIGDTIRVSLSAHPCEEVSVAYEILKCLGLRQRGPTLVSCPSCGRTEIDVVALAEAVNRRLKEIDRPIKVAVMGCVVNGPGEARDADVGIAGGRHKGIIFRKGKIVKTVPEEDLLDALMAEISSLPSDSESLE